MDIGSGQIERLKKLITTFRFSPRQIQEVFRTLGHIFSTTEEKKRGKLLWCLIMGTILMVVVKIGNSNIFYLLSNQKLKP